MIGYDKFFLNWQLYLGLTFEEMTGTLACDRSKHRINCTLHGTPAWGALANGLPYLDFNSATPDWLDAPAAHNELDFQAEAFSMAAWVNIDDLTVIRTILCRGLNVNDGWYWEVMTNGAIRVVTSGGGLSYYTISAAADIVTGTWFYISASRDGNAVRIYRNGVDVTVTFGTHADPDSATRELHIGVGDNETLNPFDGKMWYPRIWGSRCLADWEMSRIFAHERGWFGV